MGGGDAPFANRAGKSMTNEIRSVLVTGGGGFIGSHIAELLLREGYEVGVLDNFTHGSRENLAQLHNVRVHTVDILDTNLVKETVSRYDAIVHEAALVSVARSVEDPIRTSMVNVDGTLNMLTAARDSGVKRFVYASSSSVYGESVILPKTESMKPQPISPYAVSKLAAENYCRVFAEVYGLRTVCLRYFNVYGPRQKHGPYSGVIPAFVKAVMRGEPPVIFGDGKQTRDFTYVEDAANANLLCLRKEVESGTVFNVGAGSQVLLNELVSTVERLMGRSELGVRYAPPRPGDIRDSYADISLAESVLGYAPHFSLELGLKNVIAWFRSVQ